MLSNIVVLSINGKIDSHYATLTDLCKLKNFCHNTLKVKKFPIVFHNKNNDFYRIDKFHIIRAKDKKEK